MNSTQLSPASGWAGMVFRTALSNLSPIVSQVAAVSVGVYKGTPVLDLDYPEDCNAETDMNVVMSDAGDFIEVQVTGYDDHDLFAEPL